jgi:hypothetical protein
VVLAEPMSEQAHLAAVKALLSAANAVPLTLAEAKAKAKDGTLPASYNEVTVSQKVGSGPRRAGAPSQVTQWRVVTRAVAQTYGNAQEMRRRAALALDEAKVTVAGEDYFIERAVSDDPIAEDDTWWSGVSEFGY